MGKQNLLNRIPGTTLDREKMGGATGEKFLNKIFYISDGIMLAYIREISGVDGTTLQNWVKRGWVINPKNKLYNKDQLARILIINMMRDTMQLSKISFLLKYINGDLHEKSDDIITESKLYDYICKIIDCLDARSLPGDAQLKKIITDTTADYEEKCSGARRRLVSALEIIVLSYWASLIKETADLKMSALEENS